MLLCICTGNVGHSMYITFSSHYNNMNVFCSADTAIVSKLLTASDALFQ